MKMLPDKARVHLKIEGRVQGVYFRASTVSQAQHLGLTGWVMNCPDGSVEAVAEGGRAEIEQLIAWCRLGPSGARVTNVGIRWEQPQESFVAFSVRRG
jgi:acylphosphatase